MYDIYLKGCKVYHAMYADPEVIKTSFTISTRVSSPSTCSLLATIGGNTAFRWEGEKKNCLLAADLTDTDISKMVKINEGAEELVYVCQNR